MRSGALDVIVVDSVAALVPRAEIEGEMGDSHVGIQARLMSQALRKLSGAIKQSNVSVMFTNQLRDKIGVMYGCFHYNRPASFWLTAQPKKSGKSSIRNSMSKCYLTM